MENKLHDYLAQFAAIAPEYFANNQWLTERFEYFQEFFKREHLSNAQWEDFQTLGNSMHTFLTMAIAKYNALGRPNLPIERYREIFLYITETNDSLQKLVDNLFKSTDGKYFLPFFGNSSTSELIAYAKPHKVVLYNKRTIEALEFLEIPIQFERGSTFGQRFEFFNNQMKPILESYSKIVGQQTETSLPLELDQFFNWLYKTVVKPEKESYGNSGNSELIISDSPSVYNQKRKFWLIAPGENANRWEYCQEKGIIGIGWSEMGDLSRYRNREELKKLMVKTYKKIRGDQRNNSLCLWQFANEINIGDIIICKKGRSSYVGYGVVTGDYEYSPEEGDMPNIRSVEWLSNKVINSDGPIVTKTMTNITRYAAYVKKLSDLYRINETAGVDQPDCNYFWLFANPKIWSIREMMVGQEQFYTALNDRGNKRQRYECFKQVKKGDLIIGYESSPTKRVVAILEVTQPLHLDEDLNNEVFYFKLNEFISKGLTYDQISAIPELSKSEPLRSSQGSLFKLTKTEFDLLSQSSVPDNQALLPYDWEHIEHDVFVAHDQIETMLDALSSKKNIVLQGSPGVGKSYLAKRLAYLMMGEKDNSRIEVIQFHQSYSYEDFIQGYRPTEGGHFKLEHGIFYRFCQRANADRDNDYFFIIDEINRGNLSKIFGELMLLLEHDKRDESHAVSLTYGGGKENKFSIPSNVHIIGTMNTADRSLALVDYALRRRFAFIQMEPTFNERFKNHLLQSGVPAAFTDSLIRRINDLNKIIESDEGLGRGFKIGHSYFCSTGYIDQPQDWLKRIIDLELEPLLIEYWFDNAAKANEEVRKMRSIIE